MNPHYGVSRRHADHDHDRDHESSCMIEVDKVDNSKADGNFSVSFPPAAGGQDHDQWFREA